MDYSKFIMSNQKEEPIYSILKSDNLSIFCERQNEIQAFS